MLQYSLKNPNENIIKFKYVVSYNILNVILTTEPIF